MSIVGEPACFATRPLDRRRPVGTWLLALAALTSAAVAQESDPPLRGPAIGEVRDADGKPWVGAEVVLLARPLPQDPNVGTQDRVTATTDQRGRFHAAVLHGRPYTVWAWGEPTAAGRPATDPAERVFARQPVVLRQSRTLPRRVLVLDRIERWQGSQGFRVRVVDRTWNRGVQWCDVVGDRLELPFTVGLAADLELFARRDGHDVPLASRSIAAEAADVVRIELPERRRATCWPRASGKACVDAAVFRRMGGALYPAGRTDGDGKLALDIVAGAGPEPTIDTLVIAANCCTGLCSSVAGPKPGAADLPAGHGPDDLYCNLVEGRAIHLRCLGGDGRPLAGAEVLFSGMANHRPTRSSAAYGTCCRSVVTDADGLATIAGASTASACVHLLLGERELRAVPAPWRQGLAAVAFAPLVGSPGSGTAADPYVVDLRRMCPVDFAFTDPGGVPAAGVSVKLAALLPFTEWPWSSVAAEAGVLADARGHVRLLVPGGRHLGLQARRGANLLIRGFETTVGRPAAAPAAATFELPPPLRICGTLRLPGGNPAAGQHVFASLGSNDPPAQWSFASEPAERLADPEHNVVRLLLPEAERERLMLANLISVWVDVGADGSFCVPMTSEAVPDLLLYHGEAGTRTYVDSYRLSWRGESIDGLEWQARF